ncbi:MAG: hypothetical protein WCK71_00020 [bacterium]
MLFDYDYFNFILSELVGRIASDQLIIEDALGQSKAKTKAPRLLKILVKRNKINIDLLSQLLFISRQIGDFSARTANLVEAIALAESSFQGVTVRIRTDRVKPLVDVMGEVRAISSIIRIILDIIILEDLHSKDLSIGLRRRGDYVTVRIAGSKALSTNQFLKDVVDFVDKLIKTYGGSVRFVNYQGQRVVFIRMQLSNQIPLLYNK